jgi:proline dehydrogenase
VTTPLRAPTLWITERGFVRKLMTEHRLGRQVAGRFVAGDTLDAGIAAARSLDARGIAAMLDHLGENVTSPSQASEATDNYVRALKRLQEWPDIDCNMSVKLTQLGMDVSTDLCGENMERVLQTAAGPDRPILVMIDMESSEYVDRTLDVYLGLRDRYPSLGVCLQAYLYRTAEDVRRIAIPDAVVRVAKGAYLEPPEVAYRRRGEVRTNFGRLAATLLAAGSVVHLATHDVLLVEGARRFIRERGIAPDRFEFQMLYGIRRDLQARLEQEGEPVRVYIPYGTQWYPYLTRRLAERPANVWFFLSNLFRRGG